MPFIAFLGCDGSGKSAVIRGAAEQLQAAGSEVVLGHWRPRAFSGLEKENASAADDPHGKAVRGGMASIAKLAWLALNWWIAWWKTLGGQARRGYVLFDRFHGDLVVDPHRYRYGGPSWLARFASRCMPQPDLVLFLDADPDVLLSRKQEVSREALERARARYLDYGRSLTVFRRIDAGAPLDEVIRKSLEELRRLE
jgi:thymidylate kinase